MKSVGELTELERLRLNIAMAHVSDQARAYAFSVNKGRQEENWTFLLCAAREFDKACRDAGLDGHWVMKIENPSCCEATE